MRISLPAPGRPRHAYRIKRPDIAENNDQPNDKSFIWLVHKAPHALKAKTAQDGRMFHGGGGGEGGLWV
jgi:hypothetical protein